MIKKNAFESVPFGKNKPLLLNRSDRIVFGFKVKLQIEKAESIKKHISVS